AALARLLHLRRPSVPGAGERLHRNHRRHPPLERGEDLLRGGDGADCDLDVCVAEIVEERYEVDLLPWPFVVLRIMSNDVQENCGPWAFLLVTAIGSTGGKVRALKDDRNALVVDAICADRLHRDGFIALDE